MGGRAGERQHLQIAVGDLTAAVVLTLSAVAALFDRERRKQPGGEHVDVAITDVLVSLLARYAAEARTTDARALETLGYGVYGTSDDLEVALGCIEDEFWARFVRHLGQDNPLLEFLSRPTQAAHVKRAEKLLADVMSSRNRAEWLNYGEANDLPISPVNAMTSVADDSQLQSRGMFGTSADGLTYVGFPAVFASHERPKFTPAPRVGGNAAELGHDHPPRAD